MHRTDRDRPIVLFDSGIGGLSVYREVRRLLPNEEILYLADQGFGPYGERSLSEVRARAESIVDFSIDRGAKAIVIACNSASAAALHHLRRRHPAVPFIGMEPAVKPAALGTSSGVIGVMATEATFQGALFASVVDRHANGIEIIAQVCTGLAAAVERDGDDVDDLVEGYVTPIAARGADHIVLGCTHYALIADRIQRTVGDGIVVVDPAPAVARQVGRVLSAGGSMSGGGVGTATFLTTGSETTFAKQLDRILGFPRVATPVDV